MDFLSGDAGMPPLGDRIVGFTEDGRPIVLNPDGSMSTERSTTVAGREYAPPGPPRMPSVYEYISEQMPQDDGQRLQINEGQPTNIPTLFDVTGDGVPEQLSVDQAYRHILENGLLQAARPERGLVADPVTGRRLYPHSSVMAAERSAQQRSPNIDLELFRAYRPDLFR